MKHVLITASTFPIRPDDGVPRFVLDLAQALTKRGRVTVLAPDAPGAELRERLGDVDVQRFSYFVPRKLQRLAITNQRSMRDSMRESWLAKLQVPLFMLCQERQLRRLLRREAIDAVNAHWLVPQGLIAARVLKKNPRIKLVLHVHAGDVYLLQKLAVGPRIARYVVGRADAIFADGSHVRDALGGLLGYPSGAVLQPMGVHTEAFSPQPGETRIPDGEEADFPEGFILFFGRLGEKKGTIYLVRALSLLADEYPGLGLVIVGNGIEEERLRAEVRTLHLESKVHFRNRQPHDEIIRLLHSCRAAAVPSIIDSHGETEGMPTVIVEALAAGVPVVGSRVDGIPDVIRHAENGWLCEEKDPEDLAAKLRIALSYDRQVISSAARNAAAAYDWAQVARNYWEAIDNIDNDGSTATPRTP